MDREQLKAALDEVRERFNIPSYSATVYDRGETWSFASGLSDIEAGHAADGQTLYAIGSCTKSFVAGAICVLADHGRLRFDDTVKTYLPEFRMYDPYVTENLTIRDMLCHRCGLPRHELSWYARLDTLTEEDIIRTLQYLRPNQPFRYKWQYSNQMYALAGYIVRRVSGLDWRDFVRANIFAPLGITRAAFSPAEAKALGNCAEPYLYDAEKKAPYSVAHADIGAMSSAGCIYLATDELIKWDTMLLNDGVYNGARVLSEASCREMKSPQMIRPGTDDAKPMQSCVTNHAYGFGLMTEVFEGHRLVHHGGHIDGFMADQSFLPDDGAAFAILTNLGMVRGAQVMRYVAAEKALGGSRDFSAELDGFYASQTMDLKAANRKLWSEQPVNRPCPVALEDIAGKYHENGYGDITVEVEDDHLLLHLGTSVLTGRHYAGCYFYLEAPYEFPDVLIEACVDTDAKMKVTGFSAGLDVEGPEKIHFKKQ